MSQFMPFVDRFHTNGTRLFVFVGRDRIRYSASLVRAASISAGDFVEYLIDTDNSRLGFKFYSASKAPQHSYRLCAMSGKKGLRSQSRALLDTFDVVSMACGLSVTTRRVGSIWVCDFASAVVNTERPYR